MKDLIRQLGRFPDENRKVSFQNLSNYKNGKFQNLIDTPALLEGESMTKVLRESLCSVENATPKQALPFVVTDLHALAPEENVVIWFGHSSYFMQIDGKKILVDPVFSGHASPMAGSVKAFPGSNHYRASDMPEIDVLLISHDHWDHLDYKTVGELEPKVKLVICGLGVAQHLEYWGWSSQKIAEKNWYESVDLGSGFLVTLTPARHFSGRLLTRNISLWTSFVLQTPTMRFFLGGDSGYGPHFADIGDKFGPFDLAILECGQYNEKWPYIHSLPSEIGNELKELKTKVVLPVHHSKFKLATHPWFEPLVQLTAAAEKGDFSVVTPKIGETVDLTDLGRVWEKWWTQLV